MAGDRKTNKNFNGKLKNMGRQYLMTNRELYSLALADFGSIEKTTYEECEEKARNIMPHGFPLLAIDICFNEQSKKKGRRDQPYPILKEEWGVFVQDAKTMASKMPNCYLVDGAKYALPI
ncbi:hypothetical protein Xen7305DRAFT_00008040 [Xenococcus sp. PCC 7305]|uniref:hypothetical protein n=1 Tax=Xenococcus sp. PCC 7305 TaxID=102125 RepID=UPI0002AC09AD|nr:hypothetical protein [Xenococcus sp. PCC 7305]ELS01102.1 hypothetical protein Xen7305DRAFT_00008040 [Xenococcus sp. PCC 7305]